MPCKLYQHEVLLGVQDIRQQRLEGNREMYARRLRLAKEEAQRKAEEANKRYP